MRTRKIFPLLAAVAMVAAGCGGDEQSDLDREMDLALAEDSLGELGDTASLDEEAPETETPRTETPQTQPRQQQPQPRQQQPAPQQPAPDPGPQYREMTVQAGTAMRVTLDQPLSTRTNQVGDLFTTTVASDVMAGGGVAIPA